MNRSLFWTILGAINVVPAIVSGPLMGNWAPATFNLVLGLYCFTVAELEDRR